LFGTTRLAIPANWPPAAVVTVYWMPGTTGSPAT
jgi:hypothetical protein